MGQMIERPLKFGICLDGCEAAMEQTLLDVIARHERPTYLEIGTAEGATLSAMAAILSEHCKHWTAVGLDLPEGYSLHQPYILDNAAKYGLKVEIQGALPPVRNQITVYLQDSHTFLRKNWNGLIHFAFVDGCHGRPCVSDDFLCVERFIPPGGVVVFHDFGEDSVGEPQVHCALGNTLGACRDLGLLDNKRDGWKFLGAVVGDKAKIGRDIGIFQRL